ncbi:MAG: FHA domain-containing protein [Lachnospiraceae bacterium]|nr:FHA domain-containing protein [Lachnospiraceae bacterium]
MSQNTSCYLFSFDEEEKSRLTGLAAEPKLFVSIGKEILEFSLFGRQTIGRPSDEEVPDIPVPNRYISRRHGTFETIGTTITYTPARTTNRTIFRGKALEEGEPVELLDGDELSVPIGDGTGESDILMIIAISETRISMWRTLMKESLDPRTKFGGRNAFFTWYAANIYKQPVRDMSLFIMTVDYYQELIDQRGEDIAKFAFTFAAQKLMDSVTVVGSAYQWDDASLIGVIQAPSKAVFDLFDALSDQIKGTLIDNSFRITVSIAYTDLGRLKNAYDRTAEEISALTHRTLAEAKKQNLRDCLVEYKG